MSAYDLNYVLFVIPGFMLVWSFRAFTDSERKMGEIEYAIWGLYWGILFMMGLVWFSNRMHVPMPSVSLNDIGGLDGMAAALVPIPLALGYLGAMAYNRLKIKYVYEWLRARAGAKKRK